MARHLMPALLALLSTAAFADPGYFRFPGTDGRHVVFTAEGDVWRAALSGGAAQRLTTHPLQETHALLSPNGAQVVFTAHYDGAPELYLMSATGGAPLRISYDNSRAVALAWINDSELLYTTHAERGPARTQVIVRLNTVTKARDVLPLADANEACLADDGKTLFFTRLGLHMTGDNARQYRGGMMAQLWRYELGSDQEARRINAEVPMRRPMCVGARVYYVSDADGVDNIWSMKRDGSDRKQHTHHDQFALQSATLGHDQIVYQLGADLRRYDTQQQKDTAIPLQLVSDFEQQQERWLKPHKFISQYALSPNGERVSLTARGQSVIASIGTERRVDIALPERARIYDSVISVDGKWLYAISDISGELEIWQLASDGSGERKQLTNDGDTQRWKLRLSPNGKYIAHDDKRGRLWLLELSSGRNEKIDDGRAGGATEYDDIVWSPDSRTLALTRANSARALPQILMYALDTKQLHVVTSDRYESFSPVFSRDGLWLYFLSNRTFNADPSGPWGDRNMGPSFNKRSKIYAVALQDGLRFPFAAKNELIADKKDDKKEDKNGADKNGSEKKDSEKKEEKVVNITWAGLAQRLFEVPLAAGNYNNLNADDKRLYYLEQDDSDRRKQHVKSLEIGNDDSKPETFASEVGGFALSANGKKILLAKVTDGVPSAFYVVDGGAKAPVELNKSQLRIGDWMLATKPAQEWQQMYTDAWRMHRDFLFDKNMRGVNWGATRKKYETLVSRVTDRAELDDVLAQLVAEVSVLHSQVRGGEWRDDPDAPRVGYLGAVLRRQHNGYRVEHIYQTETELPNERAPLAQPGVDAKIGDVITAVNGRDVLSVADISELLKNRVGQQVLLQLQRGEQTLKTIVMPVDGQRHAALRYSDWEESSRQQVERVGKGNIGYLHLRAMGPNDIATFVREFYANFDRDGLIIDVRRNNGGNIDAWVIEKLLKRAWAYWHAADTHPYWNQQQTFRGHLVVLADSFTYSDGETFAAGIKALNLAPVIGARTAGAGVWLSDRNRLIDGGMTRAAEFAQYGADGRWLIEGRGVSPDIDVDNLPVATFNGGDAQLQAALDYLQKKFKEQPVTEPKNAPITGVGKSARDVR